MADDKIEYKDLIQPDDSLNNLVRLLEETNKQYTTLANNVIKAAEKIETAVKKQSGATNEGRKAIRESAESVSRYEKVLQELEYAISDVGAKEAWLKARINEVNKGTVDQERYARQLEGSYERLATDLKNAVATWKALSPEMRNNAAQGGALLNTILNLRKQLSSLDSLIRGHVESLTRLQKAEQELAYAQSAEGQATARTKEQIRETNRATLEADKIAKQRVGSIDQMRTKLNGLVTEFNALSRVERTGTKGVGLISQIQALNKEITEQLNLLKIQKPVVDEVSRLIDKLALSQSQAGKDAALLRAEIAATNKATVEAERRSKILANSYDGLELALADAVKAYKAMDFSDPNRGAQLNYIITLKAQIKALKDEMSLATPAATKLQKAQQDLAYLMSAEGEAYLRTRNEINKIIASKRELKDLNQRLAEAQAKLTMAERDENIQLKATEAALRQANEQARWKAQLMSAAQGSYKAIEAQYHLNILRLKELSAAEYEAQKGTGGLVQKTQDLYNAMRRMQEATGNYSRNVGNYKKIWDGLGFSVTQVVRELPAAAISANTFFLAISNNIPMIIDEVKKLRIQNEAARRAGEKTTSVWKAVAGSLFSFNTALVLVLTAFSLWGKEIVEWISSIGKARGEIMSLSKALTSVNEQLIKEADNYAKSRTSLEKLRIEWSKLTSDKEKLQFIKDNKQAFDQLDVSITNVTDAESLLEKNTDRFITVMKLRAKAIAATTLAQEQYAEALKAETKQGYYTDKEGKTLSFKKGESVIGFARRANLPFTEALALAFTNPRRQGTTNKIEARLKNLNKDIEQAEGNAEQFLDIFEKYFEASKNELKALGLDESHKKGSRGRQPRDLTDVISRNGIELRKKYEQSITNIIQEEYTKRRKAIDDQAKDEIARLEDKERKNLEYLENADNKYKELTEEQRIEVLKQNQLIADAIVNITKKRNYDLDQLEREHQAKAITILRETLDWSLDDITESIKQERALKLKQLDEEAKLELETNKDRDEAEITAYYAKKKIDTIEEYNQQILKLYQADNDARLDLVKKGSQEELEVLLRQNELARQLAISQNRSKPAAERVDESLINQQFNQKALSIQGTFELTGFDEAAAAAKAEFDIVKHTQDQITEYTLNAQKERLQKQLELVQKGMLKMSYAQILQTINTIDGIDAELDRLKDPFRKIGEKGLGYTLLESLGLDDDQINAVSDAVSIVISNLQEIAAAEVELAEKAVEAAERRVDAAQKAYDAEVEARNNGYANNVATTRKELEQEKKKQAERQKLLEAAQRRQEALNTIAQASSLVTASALIWSQLGFPFAIPAIAAMWTSFAVAKIKARQVTAQADEYGEGGLEFLEGGSHASGNDIDLGTKNHRGRQMRAEGGEALAIINRKHTRKYKAILPDVINSLNKGTFEDKYANAFNSGQEQSLIITNSNIDLSRIEGDVRDIKKQNETRYYSLSNGDRLIVHKNVKRIIKN